MPTGRHIYFGVNLHAGTRTASNSRSSGRLQIRGDLGAAGTDLAITILSNTQEGKAVEPMKIESFFVAVSLLVETNLFARVLTQGLELALVATAIEWSTSRIRAAAKLARSRR